MVTCDLSVLLGVEAETLAAIPEGMVGAGGGIAGPAQAPAGGSYQCYCEAGAHETTQL